MVELHSQGSQEEGAPMVKKLGMTAQMTVDKEFVEEQFGKEGFLFAPGFAETMLVIALAFVSIRRINDRIIEIDIQPRKVRGLNKLISIISF